MVLAPFGSIPRRRLYAWWTTDQWLVLAEQAVAFSLQQTIERQVSGLAAPPGSGF
jgi:hypothetical protein